MERLDKLDIGISAERPLRTNPKQFKDPNDEIVQPPFLPGLNGVYQ